MKVSVIIPTFNRASLVVETLESALSQTFEDREIIVIDDGSRDNTKQRLTPYLDQIIYIYQENKGVNAARNHGLSIARGEYIALLDSDDLWQPFLLELFVSILDSNENVGFVYSNFALLKPDRSVEHNTLRKWYTKESDFGKVFRTMCSLESSVSSAMGIPDLEETKLYFGNIYRASLFHATVLPSASLFRRSHATYCLPFNEDDPTCGDWEFFAKLSNLHGAAFVDIEAAFNRSHDDEVRLMRIDLGVRLRRRIAFIERVWKEDAVFMNRMCSEVYAQMQTLYFALIKYDLINGNGAAARESIQGYRRNHFPGRNIKLSLLILIARLPGSAALLRWLRIARDKFLRRN